MKLAVLAFIALGAQVMGRYPARSKQEYLSYFKGMVSDFSQKKLELVIGSPEEDDGSVQSFKIVTKTDLEKHKISI